MYHVSFMYVGTDKYLPLQAFRMLMDAVCPLFKVTKYKILMIPSIGALNDDYGIFIQLAY